jgi:hypothetical protein
MLNVACILLMSIWFELVRQHTLLGSLGSDRCLCPVASSSLLLIKH